MRYLIQLLVMLSDVFVVVALCIIWNQMPGIFAAILTGMVYYAWRDSGGFMAWRPSKIKQFLNNAKELGI